MISQIFFLVVSAVLLVPLVALILAIAALRRVGRVEERLREMRRSLLLGAELSKPPAGTGERGIDLRRVQKAEDISETLPRPAPAAEGFPSIEPLPPKPIHDVPTGPAAFPPSQALGKGEPASAPISAEPESPSDPWVTPPGSTPSLPRIDWEKFTGVKILSWIGGFALFLGAVFFAKYSMDHGWVTPAMRLAGGLVLGVVAVVAGLKLRERYAVTAQTLAAAGAAILYVVAFAARALYGFIGATEAFAFLSLVTVLAFLLSARMNSQYIAILALVGGFLVPPLVSTGVDRPLGLFAYITLLDLGLLALVTVKGWNFLWGFAAAGTAVMMAGWWGKFFGVAKMPVAAAILLWFPALFAAARGWMETRRKEDRWTVNAAGLISLVSLFFGALSLAHSGVRQSPLLAFAVLFGADIVTAWLAVREPKSQRYHLAAGVMIFLTLLTWTSGALSAETLPTALGAYLAFGALHGGLSLVLYRRGGPRGAVMAGHLFPVALLLPLTVGLLKDFAAPALVWPVAFGLNLIALFAAVATGFLWAALAALGMTFLVVFLWIPRLAVDGLPGLLAVIAVMAGVFFGAGYFLLKKKTAAPSDEKSKQDGDFPWTWPEPWKVFLPALSGFLPFFLLATAAGRLRPEDPSSLFALAALLAVLLLGLLRAAGKPMEALGLVALGGVALVEYAWHGGAFAPDRGEFALMWFGFFAAAFLLLPLVFPERFGKHRLVWVAAALSGPVHFLLYYRSALAMDLSAYIGVLPAFWAVVYLTALAAAARAISSADPHRRSLLALFGAVSLFFITLIFPLQFEKQWITLGWALEGVALLWLHRRLPHEGLKAWAFGLLAVAFVRLALNPAVFAYHARADGRIINWYLYAFGVAAACQFVAARLWPTIPSPATGEGGQQPRFLDQSPGIFNALGIILLFLLMNIQIADFFSTGATLTFNLRGSIAQDLAYTLAWGLFGLALLFAGLWKEIKPARWAALALLGVTIGKLFLHDIWRLPLLHRSAAFAGLAVMLIAGSFLFQRHQNRSKEDRP